MRTGIVARKLGMSSLFSERGERVPVTILHLEECEVIGHKTKAANGYDALVLGLGEVKEKNLNKPQKVFFEKNNIKPRKLLKEFRIAEDAFVDVGQKITVEHFVVGQFVDVAGESIGKGFAGGMKRHNFRGLEASHGVSVSHRSIGSTGGRQDPGRVFKNKKMPGHLGCERVTTQNIQVVAVDAENSVIMVKGNVPGAENSLVEVTDAIKRPLHANAPYPTNFGSAA
jgi:large subunit ribosomal protein L3